MTDPLIRWRTSPAAPDITAVRALVAATGVFSPEEIETAGELVATTLDGTETYQFVFAEDAAGALLGYACFDRIPLSAVSYDLYWIAVTAAQRGRGLARELISRVADTIRSQGGLQLFAETSATPAYTPARTFYLRSRFTEAARFADFYARGDDKLVYRLAI